MFKNKHKESEIKVFLVINGNTSIWIDLIHSIVYTRCPNDTYNKSGA